jgi:Mlc titration factor MtfA (ptsG expression regulator)
MSLDDIVSFDNSKIPNEISLEDKATLEQLQLINELDPEEKTILLKLIETFVSKKRFKDYLQQNIATL